MTPSILNPMLSVTGKQLIDRPSAQFDWYLLQKFLGTSIATLGIDPSGAGADPTGSIDATDAIQHILNTSINQNQIVALFIRPNAIYKISAPLVLPTGNLVFIYGGGWLQLADGANCDMIQSATDGSSFAIHDIIFVGTAGSQSGIHITNGGASLVQGCQFLNWDVAGINLKPATGKQITEFTIAHCQFNNNGTDIQMDATDGPIDMVKIDACSLNSNPPFITTPLPPASGFPGFSIRGCSGLTTTPVYDMNFFWPTPQGLAYQTSNQTILTGTLTVLTFDTAAVNRRIWNAGSPTRFTAPVDGTYLAVGQVTYTGVSVFTAFSVIGIYINGGFTTPFVAASGQLENTIQVTAPLLILTAGDYVEFVVQQNQGSSATTLAGSTFGSLQLQRIP